MPNDAANQRLTEALAGLRQVFGDCRGTAYWGEELDSRITTKKPVWFLTNEEFQDFACHSICLGLSDELAKAIRYFLPRVAALHASPDHPLYRSMAVWDPDHLAKLLNEARWLKWRDEEVWAIREWLFAWIQYQACEGNWWVFTDTVRCAALAGCDLFAFFDDFHQRHPTASVVWIATELEHHWDALLTTGWPRMWRNCWGVPTLPEVAEEFLVVLLRKSSRQLLEQKFYSDSLSAEHQALVSSALEHANHCVEFGNVWPEEPLGRALVNPRLNG